MAYLVREDLHVAGEHNDIDPLALDQPQQRALLQLLGLRRHDEVVEWNAEGLDEWLRIAVVGDHADDVHLQRSAPPSVQQVVQAVIVVRDHDQDPGLHFEVEQPPLHREPLGDRDEPSAHDLDVGRALQRALDAHAEDAGRGIAVLLAVDDRAVQFQHEA